jgi:hypothetical protein
LSGTRRRIAALVTVGIIGVPLAVVATAFACANLYSARLNTASAKVGQQVSIVVRNVNTSPAASPLQVRWNGRSGQVLAEGRPVGNKFRATFTVPKAKAGYYVVLATQSGPNGRIASGSPGRAPLRVKASTSEALPVAGTPGGGPGGIAPTVLTGLLTLALFGGAGAMGARRRSGAPHAALQN